MADDVKALLAEAREWVKWNYGVSRSENQNVASIIERLADALEVKERENPSNCTCGYGGFHEPENKNCEANND